LIDRNGALVQTLLHVDLSQRRAGEISLGGIIGRAHYHAEQQYTGRVWAMQRPPDPRRGNRAAVFSVFISGSDSAFSRTIRHMMQQLRDSTKIIMILVSISFVGLMVFEWGMDFSGRGPGGGSPTRLGSVNGAEISIDEYQQQYRLLYEQAQQRAPEGTLSAEQQSQLEEEAWEAVIDFALLRREVTRRDLTVTDTELIEFIRSNPPRDVINLPAFQTDGQFDIQKYQRALTDPALAPTWAEYEAQLRPTPSQSAAAKTTRASRRRSDGDRRGAARNVSIAERASSHSVPVSGSRSTHRR
jgi:hypothetical protein